MTPEWRSHGGNGALRASARSPSVIVRSVSVLVGAADTRWTRDDAPTAAIREPPSVAVNIVMQP